ncbi:hypothetical protein [Nocardia amamiensis]|nr:hypothetical protein [Nocardia amamiensis]
MAKNRCLRVGVVAVLGVVTTMLVGCAQDANELRRSKSRNRVVVGSWPDR